MGSKNSGGGESHSRRQTGDLIMGRKRTIEVKSGDRYGELTVIREVEKRRGCRRVECLCSCGTIKTYDLYAVRKPNHTSCGCKTKHGLCPHPLYKTWSQLKVYYRNRRHNDTTDVNMCSDWYNNFLSFYTWAIEQGWHPGLRIALIDSSKQCSPRNCKIGTVRDKALSFKGTRKDNTSGYRGVYSVNGNRWYARLGYKNKIIRIGGHESIEDAVRARNKYIMEHGLEKEYEIQEIKNVK